MKNFTLLFTTILMSLFSLAQAPQGINYQSVIRDGDGNILPNMLLTLQMTIRSGAPDGEIVYVETHDATTNAFGLVNLVIGYGVPQSNAFSDINWGDGEKYLETAIDLTGGGSYTILGVTQFLSTPYSYYSQVAANGVQSMSLEERDALQNPPTGMQIYNTTTNCLNYFNGTSWFETCGDCTPMPSVANAGLDQLFFDNTTSTTLEGNSPQMGEGLWTIESGQGGVITDPASPTSGFTGQQCETYVLRWTISTPCHTSYDELEIQFDATPTVAAAGEDQLFLDNTTFTSLEGNTPLMGEGLWTIQSGQGGVIADPASPTSGFTGQQCETYVLRWTISTPCHTSWDEIEIQFDATPTVADAGEDQSYADNTTTVTLEGNTPIVGEGTWTVVNGQGGSFDDVTDPNTEFSGQQCQSYNLKWEISTPCHESSDEVTIEFNNTPTVADADTDQWYLQGTSTTLEANAPENGLGYWSIVSGSGGTIQFPTNPSSVFIGQQGVVYELKWTISTECNSSSDNVTIYFGAYQCGLLIFDIRDNQLYETVQIGDQCWMAENLAYLPEVSPSSQGNNTDPYFYVYDYQGSDVTEAKATTNYQTYGVLYNWPSSLDACPTNWHLPADAEWTILITYLGGESVAGGKMKETGTSHWNSPNTGATNSSGFTGLPGGNRYTDGMFNALGFSGYFWSSTEYSTTAAWLRILNDSNDDASSYVGDEGGGFSVRCLRD